MDDNREPELTHRGGDVSESSGQKRKRKNRRRLTYALFAIFILMVAFGGWFYMKNARSPIPKNISQSVSFPIYYPDQKKLPQGYTLSLKSFTSPQKGVILYSVKYKGKKLVFSLQKKPSDNDIQSFYLNYIPLRNKMQTQLGQAEIGAYRSGGNLQTVVSLPTNKGTWLIITAPYDINQNQLKQILDSLKS